MRIKDIKMQDRGRFFSHIIVIVMLFVLPEILLSYANPRGGRFTGLMYVKSAAAIAVFYINYYLVIGRTIFGRRRSLWKFLLCNLLVLLAVLALIYGVQYLMMQQAPPQPEPRRAMHRPHGFLFMSQFIVRDLVMMVLTVALAVALKFADKWNDIERHNAQLVASQKQDELLSLKSQLNPHFLFNTLNTIYSLIEISPKEAQQAVHTLSKMLRYVLYENPATVDLSRELDFVRSYISLMEKRLGPDAVKASLSVPGAERVQVAPLLMVTLLENAFKHGNTGVKGQPIEISVSIDPDGCVVCRTFNHFLSSRPREGSDSGGIGIANLRRRLALIYGSDASLETHSDGNTYTAVLRVPPHTDCK